MLLRRIPRAMCLPAAIAAIAPGCVASAQAGVVFPAPGRMQFSDLPARVQAGHTFTLREVMPLAIWGGELEFQRQSASGAWETLSSAPPRPRVVWLHWRVPGDWRGAQLTVRFRLENGARLLALSGSYTITVTP